MRMIAFLFFPETEPKMCTHIEGSRLLSKEKNVKSWPNCSPKRTNGHFQGSITKNRNSFKLSFVFLKSTHEEHYGISVFLNFHLNRYPGPPT